MMLNLKTKAYEFYLFGLKQANAAVFGGALLFIFLITEYVTVPFIHRYDLIFISAILIQIVLVLFKLETKKEVLMIAVFHGVATLMELFKTSPSIGSWSYPGEAFFYIATVPLFTGFLYSAVGSYIARAWRIFHFRFTQYPKLWMTYVLGALIYINFFTHHFVVDIRLLLFATIVMLFGRTKIHFIVLGKERWMPLLLGFFLVAIFIWFAENIGTFTSIWLYPSQVDFWHVVPIGKLGSWFLLMILSFILISTIYYKELRND